MERTRHFDLLKHENLITKKPVVKKLPEFKSEGDIRGLKESDR